MPSNHGQTSHLHDDYKIQRDLERVARQGKSKMVVQGGGSGSSGNVSISGGTGTEPATTSYPWALSVRQNYETPIINPKMIQSLNFLGGNMMITGAFSKFPIKFEVESEELENKYKSVEDTKIKQARIRANLEMPYIVTRNFVLNINTLPLVDPGGITPEYMHRYTFDTYNLTQGKYGIYVWTEIYHGLKLAHKDACHVSFRQTDTNQSFMFNWHPIDNNTIAVYGIYKDLTYLEDFYGNQPTITEIASDKFMGFNMLSNRQIEGQVTISVITGSFIPYG